MSSRRRTGLAVGAGVWSVVEGTGMLVVTMECETASKRITVLARLLDTVAARGQEPALRWQQDGAWRKMSWDEYATRASRVASGLRSLGVQRGERVGLLMRSRPEFHVSDLGAMLAGAVPVSFYNTSPPERLAFLVRHCGATVVVVDDPTGFERISAIRCETPELRHIVAVDDVPAGGVSFGELQGAAAVDLEAAASRVAPSDLATVIYTSGTTGTPKGAMISHENVASAIDGALGALGHDVHGYDMISALPMAHVAERVASHYLHMSQGTCVTTCPDVALLPMYLTMVRPRAFFAVPRLWEKAAVLIKALADLDPAGRDGFDRAISVGTQVAGLAGTDPDPELARAFDETEELRRGVRALVGLDRCEVAVTTAAPISADVLRFFRSLGVPLSELYGLSEATGPVTWDPVHPVPGDCGMPLPGTDVRISDDGEVLVRGPVVFSGYLDDPEATAAMLDGGWLHTGDLGFMEGGRLRLVGRKKDILVTAGGENVAPSGIESLLRSHRLVSEAFVAGDGRPYLVALLTLDPEARGDFLSSQGTLVQEAAAEPPMPDDQLIRQELSRWVDEVNQRVPRVEQVKRFAVLEEDWNPDSDELTPTMKVKRQAVLDKFAAEIDRLYR
jgi:long-chain acyl-CoA synthetase